MACAAILFLFGNTLIIEDSSNISKASQHSSLSFSDPPGVKITYPEKDQSTKVGGNLEIIGTSVYNPDHICHVSVIINDVKPYQETIPTGTKAKSDYSTWKFVFSSAHTGINEGDNKITARLLCSDDLGEDLRKWYSVNVIGKEETENSSTKTLAIPASIQTRSTATPTSINIDRNIFIDLVNNRIENNTEVIRDAIEDSIMSFYTRMS